MLSKNEAMDLRKVEMKPVGRGVIIYPYDVNPYLNAISEEGFETTNGSFINEDSGEKDLMEATFLCAKVIEIGPDVTKIRQGDDIIYHKGSANPLPFMGQGFFIINEVSALAYIGENLDDRD